MAKKKHGQRGAEILNGRRPEPNVRSIQCHSSLFDFLVRRFIFLGIVLLLQPPNLFAEAAINETANLSALCKTWGILKYYSPRVASGQIDWDAALVDAAPHVCRARTKDDLNRELIALIRLADAENLPKAEVSNEPDSEHAFIWMNDELFGDEARTFFEYLRATSAPATNRYVKQAPAGNADFSGELSDAVEFPATERRLLALFRFWNMVQYFFPYRDVIGRDWSEVLREAIPRFLNAADATEYTLEVARLVASINDSHASIGSPIMRTRWGRYGLPLKVRYVQGQSVVVRVFNQLIADTDLQVGDVIASINGLQSAEVRAAIRPYIRCSNEGGRERDVDNFFTITHQATQKIEVFRDGERRTLDVRSVPLSQIAETMKMAAPEGPAWRVLEGNVGYVHLGRLKPEDVPQMWETIGKTRATIFDVRNYPNGTMYAIAERLNPDARDFVKFKKPRFDRPGYFRWVPGGKVGPIVPREDYFRGPVILLADETTQSHAEFTLMALRTAPNVRIVGARTAGADGNISRISLPGGIQTAFSGIGVFYPDGRPTQRIGIIPDIEVHPTIAGIRKGVDETLERALSLVR